MSRRIKDVCDNAGASIGKLGGFLGALLLAVAFLFPFLHITFFGNWNQFIAMPYASSVDLLLFAEIMGAVILGGLLGGIGFGYLGANSPEHGAEMGIFVGLALLGAFWLYEILLGIYTVSVNLASTFTWALVFVEIVAILGYACGIYVAGQNAKR